MKKYETLKLVIRVFNEDIVTTSAFGNFEKATDVAQWFE